MKKSIILGGIIVLFVVVTGAQAQVLSQNLAGKILLQVEQNGEAWYINPGNSLRYFMGRPADAFMLMRNSGLGISNDNLYQIPIGVIDENAKDNDQDGLSNNLENALGLDMNNEDTDKDGYSDFTELVNGYSPWGVGKQKLNRSFAQKQAGKILLQVERNGEAWYINPDDNKRYFLGRPADAFLVMRSLGLGITDSDLELININHDSIITTETNDPITSKPNNIVPAEISIEQTKKDDTDTESLTYGQEDVSQDIVEEDTDDTAIGEEGDMETRLDLNNFDKQIYIPDGSNSIIVDRGNYSYTLELVQELEQFEYFVYSQDNFSVEIEKHESAPEDAYLNNFTFVPTNDESAARAIIALENVDLFSGEGIEIESEEDQQAAEQLITDVEHLESIKFSAGILPASPQIRERLSDIEIGLRVVVSGKHYMHKEIRYQDEIQPLPTCLAKLDVLYVTSLSIK